MTEEDTKDKQKDKPEGFSEIIDSPLTSRTLYPPNTALVGRGIKNRDKFNINGTVTASSSVVSVTTDAHSNTETTLASFGFLKNEWHPNMVVRMTAFGVYTCTSSFRFTLRVGSGTAPTSEWNSATSPAGAVTDKPWEITWTGIVGTIGSSGTLEAQLRGSINASTFNDVAPNTSTVSINTTGNLTLGLTAQWDTSTTGQSVSIRQWIIEVLN